MQPTLTRNFVRAYLPGTLGAIMLLLYLVTLDKVVTGMSLAPLARASGADWRPVLLSPLTWLVTLPIRWFPASAQLVVLNLIGAVCAAFGLALLARCVAILPHDRSALQRDKAIDENGFLKIRLAWVPVVLAVLVCGLQLTFWENAIIGTGEALDLLLFAYCVRCLLEHRIDEKNSWLYKLALVYGLGVTNNFAMIAFFPAWLVALIWIKEFRFFRFEFLTRMFLLGLAGLSLYLLLPVVQSVSTGGSVSFWAALKANLSWQKQFIWFFPRWRAGWIAIYALLPLVLAAIRWGGSFGDPSVLGSAFTNAFAQLLHAAMLVFCIYIAFDPPAAPRNIGLGFAFLPAYFLGALAIGYYSGFLLLVFSPPVEKARRRFALPPVVNYAVAAIVCGGAVFTVAKLMHQNYPSIREKTSRDLHDYATSMAKSLPDKSAVVLSDDPMKLHAVRTVLGRAAIDKYILLDAPALAQPEYHRFLRQRYGNRWPKLPLAKDHVEYEWGQLNQLLMDLGQKNELMYLHPGFGSFFETFYLEPRQLAYAMRPYPPNTVEAPVPSAALIAEQTALWNSLGAGPLKDLRARVLNLPADRTKRKGSDIFIAGEWYSRALDFWGVELQRAGRFDDAFRIFEDAVALNPDNAAALVNRDANVLWRKERKRLPNYSKEVEEKLHLYPGDFSALLTAGGPVDEPTFAAEFARVFVAGGLFRQAAQAVERALAYAPDELLYQSARANIDVLGQQPDRALAQIKTIRSKPAWRTADPAVQVEVTRVEAFAHYGQNDFAQAVKILEDEVRRFPELDAAYNALWQLHAAHSEKVGATNASAARTELTNALNVVVGQLQVQPQNANAWFNHGNLAMFLGNWDGAITSFNKVLELQKENPAALLNRAIANLQNSRLDAAKKDYDELLKKYTSTNFKVYYGLGEIAYRQKDWAKAKYYYKQYLFYVPPQLPEVKTVRARLEEVKKKS